jgi:exocyst complex component 4
MADDRVQLLDKETTLLIQHTNDTPIEPYDIISDPKNVIALSLLYNSLQWLASSLRRLRHITPHQTDSSTHNPAQPNQPPMNRRWTLISSLFPAPSTIPTQIPLTPATAILFDNALTTYINLSHLSLATLRLDIRLASISLLTHSLQGPILLPSPATSASPPILALNADLGTINQNLVSHLNLKERRFVTSGLARLVDRKLVTGATAIGALNRDGASRILIDVLVAGKGLRDVVITNTSPSQTTSGLGLTSTSSSEDEDAESLTLPLSTTYYSWFLEGAPRVVELAKTEKLKEHGLRYSYDELKTLVELCFSEALGSEDREVVVGAKRALADSLLGLGEGLWDS